jgi:catechol 2,3-dioxygenase-like lactoylglutathione lyase family enzyme
VRLGQVRVLVDDFPASYRFYRDVLGLEPSWGDEGGPYASFAAGDDLGQVALFERRGQESVVELRPPGDGSLLSLVVDDLDAEIVRIAAAGGLLLGPPSAQPGWGIRVVYLRDPAGNLVEIHEEIAMEVE